MEHCEQIVHHSVHKTSCRVWVPNAYESVHPNKTSWRRPSQYLEYEKYLAVCRFPSHTYTSVFGDTS